MTEKVNWKMTEDEKRDWEKQRFMWMRTPQQALDVIAEIIHYQSPLKDQDAWLRAALALGFVEIDLGEEE